MFHLWMTRLALAAVLAMLLVPTTGRMAGSSTMSHGPMADAMCTTEADSVTATTKAAPRPDHLAMEDCVYCVLLSSLTALPSWDVQILPLPQTGNPVALTRQPPHGQRHPTGLGSRGPPPIT